MSRQTASWAQELPAEITVCDPGGILVEMNACAGRLFMEHGGRGLPGAEALSFPPGLSRTKFPGMLVTQGCNAYMNTTDDEKRFFFQSPGYQISRFKGFDEISFEVPEHIPDHVME